MVSSSPVISNIYCCVPSSIMVPLKLAIISFIFDWFSGLALTQISAISRLIAFSPVMSRSLMTLTRRLICFMHCSSSKGLAWVVMVILDIFGFAVGAPQMVSILYPLPAKRPVILAVTPGSFSTSMVRVYFVVFI